MPKRPTAWCDTCESTVYTDDVHSCYDAKALRAQQEREVALHDAERRVVEAAEAVVDAWDSGVVGPDGYNAYAEARRELMYAVRSLRTIRGGDHP